MKVKFTIINNGGEFGMGVITDEAQKEFLLELAENEELSAYNELDGEEVAFYQNTEVLGVYGPSVENARFVIDEIDEDDNVVNEIYNTAYSTEEYEEINFNTVEMDCPYVNTKKLVETYSEDDLIFGGYSIEKNIQQSYIVETDDFKPENIVLGYTNLDETFGDFPILSAVYYIDDNMLSKMWDLYKTDEEYELEEIRDSLLEMYDSFSTNADKTGFNLFLECELEMVDQEGGDSKYMEAVLMNMDGEEIFTTWS